MNPICMSCKRYIRGDVCRPSFASSCELYEHSDCVRIGMKDFGTEVIARIDAIAVTSNQLITALWVNGCGMGAIDEGQAKELKRLMSSKE